MSGIESGRKGGDMARGSIIRLILGATVATFTAVACASNGSAGLGSSVEGSTVGRS